jgi:hypothetical protein
MRPVSAGAIMFYTGATLDDSGMMIGYYMPAQDEIDHVSDQVGSFNFDAIATWPNAAIVPVNTCRHIMTRYAPCDLNHMQYSCGICLDAMVPAATSDGSSTTTVSSYLNGLPPNDYGHMFLGAVGLQPNAPFYAVVVVNWEGTPYLNTYQPGTCSPSPSDPAMLSHGLNTAANVPRTITTQHAIDDFISVKPGMSTVNNLDLAPAGVGTLLKMGQNQLMSGSAGVEATNPTYTSTQNSPASGGLLTTVINAVPQVLQAAGNLFGGGSGSSGGGGGISELLGDGQNALAEVGDAALALL